MQRLILRTFHFIQKIIKQIKNTPSRCKNFGVRIALISFLDGIHSKEKNSWYISTIESFVDKFTEPIIDKYKDVTFNQDDFRKSEYIWTCWWQGENNAPDIVKICIKRLRKVSPYNAKLVVITKDNYQNYIEIPKYILKKLEQKKMTLTAFSDILRVSLLAQYGGFWIDSTVFISENFPNSYFESFFYTQRMYDPIKWEREACKGRWSGFLISGSRDNLLFQYLKECFLTWWYQYDDIIDYVIFDYFLLSAYKKIKGVHELIDKVPNNNINIFEMYKYLNKPYSEELYNKLTSDEVLHKLTYKMVLHEKTDEGNQTLYGYLKSCTEELKYDGKN